MPGQICVFRNTAIRTRKTVCFSAAYSYPHGASPPLSSANRQQTGLISTDAAGGPVNNKAEPFAQCIRKLAQGCRRVVAAKRERLLAGGLVVSRPGYHLHSLLAERRHGARHVIGRRHEEPLAGCPRRKGGFGEDRVFICVHRTVLEDQSSRVDA